jgi:formate/nitrite transporter FocA (FNT family)
MTISLKRGIYGGAVVGFIVGMAILVYTDSPALNRWWGVFSIPISQAFGWALFGMIAGGGGLFAPAGKD